MLQKNLPPQKEDEEEEDEKNVFEMRDDIKQYEERMRHFCDDDDDKVQVSKTEHGDSDVDRRR